MKGNIYKGDCTRKRLYVKGIIHEFKGLYTKRAVHERDCIPRGLYMKGTVHEGDCRTYVTNSKYREGTT